ncbi:MAG: sigma-54 dependent transcriptional regulator [Sandaracinaceae bacterium]|nr:sigma-54 dependent transcriptional regulator [Sandaracinaceae bacterium]
MTTQISTQRRNISLFKALQVLQRLPELVGQSQAMRRIRAMIGRIAAHDTIVLIRGESGGGKKLVAEAIHRASPRAAKPLIKVNRAALVETLLLSELFGHERGAFTGATSRKKGRFELADGGTIFLDEIGDISLQTQAALLRVPKERSFERVGGTQTIRVDVRIIICATNHDLKRMLREGRFCEGLYYRLRGVFIEVPPLRKRLSDLPLIAEHLLRRIAEERGENPKRLSSDVIELLQRHLWPGNVRELENALCAPSLFADGEWLCAADFDGLIDWASEQGLESPASNPEEQIYERIRRGRSIFMR